MWTREETVRRISLLTVWLPRGARIWQMTGGPMAVTDETEALWSVEATMLHIGWQFGGRHGNKPQMRDWPAGVEVAQQASEYTEKRAAAWRRKYPERLAR
jgi:hypothetical protein